MSLAGWLYWGFMLAVFAWMFEPDGGWIDYIKSCPLWHDTNQGK